MSLSLTQILPSIAALGLAAYWLIGGASALEAWFLTGIFVPGTLIVDAGGILVQRGVLDFWDLVWFVAVGSWIGGEASFWTGRFAYQRMVGRWKVEDWPAYARAEALFARRGGLALVTGRFLGPVSGLVPLVAALAGMDRRKFALWNALGSVPYALGHVTLGYFLGDVLTRLGPLLTRLALLAAIAIVVLGVLWWGAWRILRLLPRLAPLVMAVRETALALAPVRRWVDAHPRAAGWLAQRFDGARFTGLPLTALSLLFFYVLGVWIDGLTDSLRSLQLAQIDQRLAALIQSLWTPGLLQTAVHVSALGDLRVVLALAAAALIWLWRAGRRDLAAGLALVVLGTPVTVEIVKLIFHRPRPALAYLAQGANSFPSGHAALAVAFCGMVFYAAWRMRGLGPVSATLLASFLAFVIGVSQLVLVESYLTDVLNGWLFGGLWLVAGITFAEWRADSHGPWAPVGRGPVRATATLAVAAFILSAGWAALRYDKAPAIPPGPSQTRVVIAPDALFSRAGLPRTAESLFGTPLAPINLVFITPGKRALSAVLSRAGWTGTRLAAPAEWGHALWALLVGLPDPSAPMTPLFWRGTPNSLAFKQPVPKGAPHAAHQLRLWDSGAVLADGRHLFLGAASLDNGARGGLTAEVAPEVDVERDRVVQALLAQGMTLAGRITVAGAQSGSGAVGAWITDGRAAILATR